MCDLYDYCFINVYFVLILMCIILNEVCYNTYDGIINFNDVRRYTVLLRCYIDILIDIYYLLLLMMT
jgi:hypothetical protein